MRRMSGEIAEDAELKFVLWEQVALLEDRLNVEQGRPQRCGSQFYRGQKANLPYKIDDLKKVDALRERAGMMPLEAYRCFMNEYAK